MNLEDDIFGGKASSVGKANKLQDPFSFYESPKETPTPPTQTYPQYVPYQPPVQKPVRVSKALQDEEADRIFYGGT